MEIRYIPSLIMLLAGAITCITSILKEWDVTYSLAILLVVLIVFYGIGLLAQKLIINIIEGNVFKKNVQDEQQQEEIEIGTKEEEENPEEASAGENE